MNEERVTALRTLYERVFKEGLVEPGECLEETAAVMIKLDPKTAGTKYVDTLCSLLQKAFKNPGTT